MAYICQLQTKKKSHENKTVAYLVAVDNEESTECDSFVFFQYAISEEKREKLKKRSEGRKEKKGKTGGRKT